MTAPTPLAVIDNRVQAWRDFFRLAIDLGFTVEKACSDELVVWTGLWDADGSLVEGPHSFLAYTDDDTACVECGLIESVGIHD